MSAPKRGNTILNLGEDMVETFDWDQLYIPLDKIDERPGFNPRTDYGEHDGSFASLVESIRDRGMLELPRLMPVVDKRGDWDPVECRFTIIAGHRRIAAARALGWESIRACVPDADGKELAVYDDGQQLVDALIENLQRKELNCIEVAEGISRLEKLGKTQSDIAKWIGKDQGRVSRLVRLLQLPDGVRGLLRDGGLSQSHGEELLPLLSEIFLPGEISDLAHKASAESLTASGLRNVVRERIERGRPKQVTIEEVGDYAAPHNPKPTYTDEELAERIDAQIARTLAATKGMDKEPKLSPSVNTTIPAAKDDNGLTRKDADAQFAAAMAPDPDVVPLSERPAAKSGGFGDGYTCSSAITYQLWLQESGFDESAAIVLLNRIVGPNGLSDAKKPGMWFRLEPETAQKLLELCDWHIQEHGQGILIDQKLHMVVDVYHSLMLERRTEAEKAKAALSAGFPVFEEPS